MGSEVIERCDISHVAVVVLDADARILFVNRRLAKIISRSGEDLLGRNWYEEFVPSSFGERGRKSFAQLLSADVLDKVQSSEEPLLTAAGEQRTVVWNDSILRNAAEDVIGVIRTAVRISGSEQAGPWPAGSECGFPLFFECAPDACYLSDLDGRFIDGNPAAERLTGYKREELIGKSFLECRLLGRADVSRAAVLLARSVEGQPTGPDEFSLIRKDGSCMAVDICTEPVILNGRCLVLGIARDISARKRAMDRVLSERDYFRSLFANTSEAIALLDRDYRVVDVNAAFCRLFDYARAAAVGRHIEELVVPASLSGQAEELARFGKAGQIGSVVDTVRRRRDGAIVPVSVSHVPIASEEEISGIFVMYRDITERKKGELALMQSERKYRALFEQSIDAIWVNVYDGTHVEANQAWLDMFGYSRDELPFIDLGRDIYVDPEDRADFLRRIEHHGLVADEVRFKKKDGSIMHCQRTVVARRDEHGRVNAFQGIIRDVTLEKQSEELLRRREERYRSLFEQSHEAILVVDLDGQILNVNVAAERLFGYDRRRLLSMNVTELYADATVRPSVLERLQDVGELNDFWLQFRHSDGRILDCEASSTDLRNYEGRPYVYQTLLRDVTERRRTEEAAKKNEARLRSIVTILEHKAVTEQELLDHALTEAIALTESRLGYLYLYDEDKKEFVLNTWSRETMDECTIRNPRYVYPLDQTGIWGEAVRQRRPIVVNDFDVPNSLKKGYPQGHVKLHRFATVPVVSRECIVAVVGVANRELEYTDTEILQLTLLMDSVWKEIERRRTEAELESSNRELRSLASRLAITREEERAAVAWELHDEVAQALAVLRLDIINCSESLPGTVQEKVQTVMTRVLSLLDDTIGRLRRLYTDLVPVMLEDLGLAAAIQWHIEQYSSRVPVMVSLGQVEDLRLADEQTALGLFRILEEFLVHLSSHPETTLVTVDLVRESGHAALLIADNGRGLAPAGADEACALVLAGARERARYWNGEVSVNTSQDRGVIVKVTAPLRDIPQQTQEHIEIT